LYFVFLYFLGKMKVSFKSYKKYIQTIIVLHVLYVTHGVKKTFQLHGVDQQFIITKYTKSRADSVLQCTQKCTLQKDCFGMNICKIGKKFECILIQEQINENNAVKLEPSCQAYKEVNHGLRCRQYVQDRCGPCLCFDSVSSNYRCQCEIPSYEIELRSGGYSGNNKLESYLKLNGVKNNITKRGFTVFLIDPVQIIITSTRSFDTWGFASAKTEIISFLDSISNGMLIAIVLSDSGERFQAPDSFLKLGATQPRVGYRSSYVFIGLKGTGKIAEHNGMNEMTSSSQLSVKLEWKFKIDTGFVNLTNTNVYTGD